MSSNTPVPDYALAETLELTRPDQVRAIGDPLRTQLISLLHERAATVTELAAAVRRPKSTVAHHVNVLLAAGLVHVVRTRRVRAIEERFYGRTARMFYVGLGREAGQDLPEDTNDFETALRESATAYRERQVRQLIRRARVSEDQAAEFWRRVAELVTEFDRLPRSGALAHGFVVGLYPIPDYPVLPPAEAPDDASFSDSEPADAAPTRAGRGAAEPPR